MKNKNWQDGFYAGVLVALAYMDYVQPQYDELVREVGRDELIAAARRDGQMRLSKLDKYLKLERESAAMRK